MVPARDRVSNDPVGRGAVSRPRYGAPVARHHLLLLTALTGLCVLIAGCGSSDVEAGPRVADARFDGRFQIVTTTVGGTELVPAGQPTMAIDAEFGALEVELGCNVGLGSFTLTEQGEASFRITGGSRRPCDELAEQEATILAALDGADAWTSVDGGFRFDGPATSLTVAGPIPAP